MIVLKIISSKSSLMILSWEINYRINITNSSRAHRKRVYYTVEPLYNDQQTCPFNRISVIQYKMGQEKCPL